MHSPASLSVEPRAGVSSFHNMLSGEIGLYTIVAHSARAGWARSIARETTSSGEMWRSRFCHHSLRPTRSAGRASSARRASSRRSIIRISPPSTASRRLTAHRGARARTGRGRQRSPSGLQRGPLKVGEALERRADRWRQHSTPHTSSGIVHRDLKPANIKLRADGRRRRCSTSAWPSSHPVTRTRRAATDAITDGRVSRHATEA